MVEMSRAGLDEAFIVKASELAQTDQDFYDLMELWMGAWNPEERKKIAADIQGCISSIFDTPPQLKVASTGRSDYAVMKWMARIEGKSATHQYAFGSPSPPSWVYRQAVSSETIYSEGTWCLVPLRWAGDEKIPNPIRATLLLLASLWPKEVYEFTEQLSNCNRMVEGTGPHLLYQAVDPEEKWNRTEAGGWELSRKTFKAFHLFLEGKTARNLSTSANSARALLKQLSFGKYKPKPGSPFALKQKVPICWG